MDAVEKNESKKTIILFLAISLLFLVFFGQNEIIERGSSKYWLFLFPALLLPLTNFRPIIANIFFKTWPILLMLIVVFAWCLFKDEMQALYRLVLLLLILAWLQLDDSIIRVKTLSFLYIATVIISILVYFLSDINNWGVIPGATAQLYGIWRVSFFPNIANTAFFSLFVFMVCTKDKKAYAENKVVVYLSLYFIIFSFVRCAIISLIIYLSLSFIFKKVNDKRLLFLCSLLVALMINLIIAYSIEIIQAMQSFPLIDRMLLRGQHNLSQQEIYVQMYRPWVWGQQWNIFMHSPLWMGEGIYDFNELRTTDLQGIGFKENDSVSLLIGMLAQYGLPCLFFYYFILKQNYKNAVAQDKWACAIFPTIVFIGMQWGTIFHPANALFIMYFLVLLRGKRGFV